MKTNLKKITISVVLVLAICLPSITAFALTGSATFSVTSATAEPLDIVEIIVNIESNYNPWVGAMSVGVIYDETKLDVVKYQTGPISLGAKINSNGPYWGGATINEDYVLEDGRMAVFVTGANTVGMAGAGFTDEKTEMFRMKFKVKEGTVSGVTPLTFFVSNLADINQVNIPENTYTIVNGSITVEGEDPLPTPTPTPTMSPVEITRPENPDMFVVSIPDIVPTHSYQIWAYETIVSDIFGGGTIENWTLLAPYSLGSTFDIDGNGVGRKEIPGFQDVGGNYTISIRVRDNDNRFEKNITNTFNDTQVGNVRIVKAIVDGVISHDKTEIKQIQENAVVDIIIQSNIQEGTTYTATISGGASADTLTKTGNRFSWDISELAPGKYSIAFTATGTNNTKDAKTIGFELYRPGTALEFGELSNATVDTLIEDNKFKITVEPNVLRGSYFQYSVSEPWRNAIFSSTAFDATLVTNSTYDGIRDTDYGTFWVRTNIKRNPNASADDGIIKIVENKRSHTPSTMQIFVESIFMRHEQVLFDAQADISGVAAQDIQYSYWRRDASGWVLVRDYDYDSGWTWTPSRIGDYTIQIRAKGPGALSYEVIENMDITITDDTDNKADVTDVTLRDANGDNLLSVTVTERTPIEIVADVDSADEDIMYKYIISNGYIYYVETSYRLQPDYIWVPGKSGTYRVSVLVKNSKSFGKYDYMKTFTVEVAPEVD